MIYLITAYQSCKVSGPPDLPQDVYKVRPGPCIIELCSRRGCGAFNKLNKLNKSVTAKLSEQEQHPAGLPHPNVLTRPQTCPCHKRAGTPRIQTKRRITRQVSKRRKTTQKGRIVTRIKSYKSGHEAHGRDVPPRVSFTFLLASLLLFLLIFGLVGFLLVFCCVFFFLGLAWRLSRDAPSLKDRFATSFCRLLESLRRKLLLYIYTDQDRH